MYRGVSGELLVDGEPLPEGTPDFVCGFYGKEAHSAEQVIFPETKDELVKAAGYRIFSHGRIVLCHRFVLGDFCGFYPYRDATGLCSRSGYPISDRSLVVSQLFR